MTPPARAATVTILFTDLVNSTELLQRQGDEEAQRTLSAHRRLLQESVAAAGGREVKWLGDGLMVVFPSALSAVDCAVAMQRAVRQHNEQQPEGLRLQVRVGLHVGEPIRDQEDYVGTTVVLARRLCDAASGGRILASSLVRALVGSRRGNAFRELGALRLKGFAGTVPACEVVWDPAAEPIPGQAARQPSGPLPLPALLAAGERTAFVGRTGEMARLRQQWERAREGHRHLALLSGEPGIGKTRLAMEFARSVHGEGARVLFGRAQAQALTAYQPFVEALRPYVSVCPADELPVRLAGGGLAELLPELEHRLPAVAPRSVHAGERYRLFEDFTALLAAASAAWPTVLVLDDLQWADPDSLLLLKHVVRSTQPSSLFVVGTCRDTELSRAHPLADVIADLRRDRAVERVVLEGLEEPDVAVLIGAWVEEEPPPDFVHAVYEQTEGNPFFIEEVLRHLAETGAIYLQEGHWVSRLSPDRMGIPEGVKEVIGQRLARLSDECNSVLTVASVIGREFDLEALERASDLPADALLRNLEEALAARVIAEVPGAAGCYSFSHSLIHEALYDDLTTTRRVRLHGQSLRYADSEGAKLAYEVLGSRGPYLVVCGVSNCPAVRPGSKAIARHWDRVSRHCRVILYDRRGVGYSSAPERGYSLRACVEDVRAVLDAAGAERAIAWGSPDGGPLALAFAAIHPERTAGVILAGTTAKTRNSDDFTHGMNDAVANAFIRVDAADRGRALTEMVSIREKGDTVAGIVDVLRRVPPRIWGRIIGSIGAADARPLLELVQAPVMIIHDPENNYIPVTAAHYLHEHLPGSRLEVTEEYGPLLLGANLYGKIDAFIEEVAAGGPAAGANLS